MKLLFMAQTSISEDQKTLKQWAYILGYLGAIPFLSLAVTLLLVDTQSSILVAPALHLYGAIILSFLGGLHWGRIACKQVNETSDKWFLIYSVTPSLIGWSSFLLSHLWQEASSMLIAGFLISYVIDIRFSKLCEWQSWMKPLRTSLTFIACLSLIVLLLH